MGKLRLFLENFLIYGLGGIISKGIALLMVPVITRIMPSPVYYGISDLSNTIISIGSAVAILGMYDAMYRYFFEKEDDTYKKEICSTTLAFTIGFSFLIFLLMIILGKNIASFFFGNAELYYVVYIDAVAVLAGATNGIISAPTRMQNQRKIFLFFNTFGPIISYTLSIWLLLEGYFIIALPLAGAVTVILTEIAFGVLNKKWFSLGYIRKEYLKGLLALALPLAPNFFIYWIFNSSDRIMVTNLIDLNAAGLYAVGSKLGSASQLIYLAFAGGWQYFAFSTMKDENQVETNSRVFEYLGAISFCSFFFVCALVKPIYEILFPKEYLDGFVVAPYLFLAPLLQMLMQVVGNQFLVVKKTWPTSVILGVGALLNIVFNFYFIPRIGIEGAAVGTLLGYAISLLLYILVLRQMDLFILRWHFVLTVGISVVYFFIWRICFTGYPIISLLLSLMGTAGIAGLYYKDIIYLLDKIRKRVYS